MKDHLQRFLSDIQPFDMLDEEELNTVARALTKVHYTRDMVLFVQNKTVVDHVYIVLEGKLERYIVEDGQKTLQDELGEKAVYGALSILFNKGLAISTIRCV